MSSEGNVAEKLDNITLATETPAPLAAEVAAAASAEQNVTPWDVEGAVVDGVAQAIDYNKLIEQFGTKPIDEEILQRLEKLTGRKPHIFLRRGIFFSHRYECALFDKYDTDGLINLKLYRELTRILDRYEQKKPFFLYTGRGPSSSSMHLGHLVPFVFCQWLQEVFDVPLVIQLTGKIFEEEPG